MGTNYYLMHRLSDETKTLLEDIGVEQPRIHIGKKSSGWNFVWQALRDWQTVGFGNVEIKSKSDWMDLFANDKFIIVNEYGEVLKVDEFMPLTYVRMGNSCQYHFCMNNQQDRAYAKKCMFLENGSCFDWGDFS